MVPARVSMISAIIGSSNAERDGHFPCATLASELAYQEGVDFTADLFRRHLPSPIAQDALIYHRLRDTKPGGRTSLFSVGSNNENYVRQQFMGEGF